MVLGLMSATTRIGSLLPLNQPYTVIRLPEVAD
jgi:hypothetical protein